MKQLYRILRAVVVTALILIVVVPALLFVGLSLPSVQEAIRGRTERELTTLLGCKVEIGSLGIMPFNRVVLRQVSLTNAPGDTIAKVDRLGAGVDLYSLLTHNDIIINYAEIIGLDARVGRPTPGGPLNIQPVIDALRPKDRDNPPAAFRLAVNTVVLRRCSFSYDIASEPHTPGRFNASHVAVRDLRSDIRIPVITNDGAEADIKRLSCREASGLTVSDLHVYVTAGSRRAALLGLTLAMPGSEVRLGDISLDINGWDDLVPALRREQITLSVLSGSHVSTADIAPLVPALGVIDARVDMSADIRGTLDEIDVNSLTLSSDAADLRLSLSGHVTAPLDRARFDATVSELHLSANAPGLLQHLDLLGAARPRTSDRLAVMGDFTLTGDAQATATGGYASLTFTSAAGDMELDGSYTRRRGVTSYEARAVTDGIDAGALTGRGDLGTVACDITAEGTDSRGAERRLHANCDITLAEYRGHTYRDVEATASLEGHRLEARILVPDESADIDLTIIGDLTPGANEFAAHGSVSSLSPHELGLTRGLQGFTASASIDAALTGTSADMLDGEVRLSDIELTNSAGKRLSIDRITVSTHNSTLPKSTTLTSDHLTASLEGNYDFRTIGRDVSDIVSRTFPVLTGRDATPLALTARTGTNDFDFRLGIDNTEDYVDFLRLPVSVIYPVTVTGNVSHDNGTITVGLDAPYLRQGNKLIEATTLRASIGGPASEASLDFGTTVPTKNGAMPLTVNCHGSDDIIDTGISWHINRPEAYRGDIGLTTRFSRDADSGRRDINVLLRQSQMIFNDTLWNVRPASVDIRGREIDVNDIYVGYDGRYARIDGRVSPQPEDTLTLELNDISLDYIFQTLAIDKVQLGGDATGTFYATQLLSGEPHISTPGLNVRNISYNRTVFGDAVVRSGWDPASRGITLDADIAGLDSCRARVRGAIMPLSESLDITFDAEHLPVGFMQYYMEAFTGDLTGRCSGRARLFGTFKYLDMEGDIKAEGLRMRIDFTNTYYTTSDSVHLRPGLISIDRATLHDAYGNTAQLSGWVRHRYFKEPAFDFNISGARDFLAYNETERENPVWHGRVFGTGGASVRGVPGHVDINVDMRTCPNSTFTFVLSDAEEADEYSFVKFRDRAALERPDTVDTAQTTLLVKQLKSLVKQHEVSVPTTISIDIEADITPDATIVLVMDPVGGDRIRAVGRGNLRMLYSTTDELKMYGNYTLDRGSYNFTLQDIIIKDFTIREGSAINFRGDPYNADLDIKAAYSLNANLSDLDESFLQDKELSRTNVPVNAILLVDGSIQSPGIKFDLEFPTLTSDTYRKVRSIVSTDDMMNRQIIYLLALNRFYTPDYMASTTKGNELVSVASSTISSQLSSILGQLSDNWMIAPQFRSDRGDFSDVEVDLALSSTLLNNRLLFNGNFGYRDKSLNNTQFIGDFDIEYLLNRTGSIRLKAYNRYNDRNYYIKSATTTQGVGIMFKRDFDLLFNFLKPKKKAKSPASDADRQPVQPQ